ncbi:MAG: lipid II flippase MurJ [Bacillota bacterium]
MRLNILKSEGTNKAIMFSMSFSMIAKVFTFAQSMVVSYAFGTQKSTDILFYVLSMIILLTTLLSSVNQQVIIPTTIDIRNNASEEDSKKFISYVYIIYLIIGALMTSILLTAPDRIFAVFSKFGIEDIRSNISIIRYILPAFLFIIVNTYVLDVFTTYRYFTLPMVLDMVKNVIIISFVLIFRDVFSVESLAIGVFVGNLTQFLILNFLLFAVLKCRFSFKRYRLSPLVKKNIVYVIFGQLTTFLNGFIIMYLMSGFDEGVYSAMDYSQKINTVFSLVIVGQIATVVGMNIIEHYTKNRLDKINQTFISYLKVSLFFIIPFCFLVSLCAEPIISIVFERGRFTKDAVRLASGFLKYFILTIPYILVNSFVVRLIIAKQIQKIAFWWQVSQSAGSAIIIWLTIRFLGYYGYPVGALAANYIYIFLLLYFLLRYQFKFIDNILVIKYFILNMGFNVIVTVLTASLTQWIERSSSLLTKLLYLLIVSIVYMALYLTLGYITRINRDITTKVVLFAKDKIKSRLTAGTLKKMSSDS